MELKNIWGTNSAENFFRKKIILAKRPREAYARIFCDTGYELFINGRIVATVDEWCNTEDYAVKIYLQPGENIIAIHGINHGGHRALAFELSVDGETVCVSDESWKFSCTEKWGWLLKEYNDDGWKNARVLNTCAAGGPQWWTRPGSNKERVLYPRDNSQFFFGNVPKGCDSPFYSKKKEAYTDKAAAALLGDEYIAYTNMPSLPDIVNHKQILENYAESDGNSIVVNNTQRYTGKSFVVDMGREVVGFFRMKVESEENVSIRLYYGETIDDTINEMNVDNCQYRMLNEDIRLCRGAQEFESRVKTAFRYVKVELYNCKATVSVSDFSCRTVLYPVNKRGYFKCSDERMNRLWEMSERTVHFCMQEYIIDAPRRDRFLWTGDLRLAGLFNFYLYGDTDLFEYSMECLESVQYPNGAIPSSYGMGCSTLWDYIAWYIIAYEDYYMFTGKLEFPLTHLESIKKAADYLISVTDETGLIRVPENPLGNLWMVVLSGYAGYDPFLNELYYRSLNTVRQFCELAGECEKANEYASKIENIKVEIDNIRKNHRIEEEFNHTDHISIQYEIAEQYAKENNITAMLNRLNRHWGIMVDSHSDCVHEGGYEGRDLVVVDERNTDEWWPFSYCHAWSAAAVSLLPMGIAGIRMVEPGFKSVTIKPYTEAYESFECAVPTPFGEIAIKYENKRLSYVIPEGIEAKLIWNGEEKSIEGNGLSEEVL